VDIEDSKKAKIAMKAIVINDVEDLEDVDMYFVVGYPNFMYADMLSPMNLTESLSQFIAGLERGRSRPPRGILAQSVTPFDEYAGERRRRGEIFDFSVTKKTPGASEEDLFLYHKKGISLKKGERASQVNLHFIRGLGYYYGSMYDQAIMEFMNTLKLAPGHADARFWMGRSYLEEKEYDHARVEFDRFLREFPGSSLAPQARAFLRQCGK